MPANPGRMDRFKKTMFWAWSALHDGHAVDGAAGGVLGGRVDRVISANDQGHVGGRHLRIGLVHLHQLFVGHVGLGQEDVHVPGHTAGDRVDGVDDVDPPRCEGIG